MLLRNHLTALLKAIASRIATFRSLVVRSALNLYNLLYGSESTQESQDLEEPRLLSFGSTGFVYQLSDAIVVKKSRHGRRDHILHEQNIFALLQRQPLSPYIIRHFHDANDAIFLEFVSGGDLGTVLNNEQVKDKSTQRVTQVKSLQSAQDYTRWIRQLATAAAWLEQLGLAHCDIRPANMLLSKARNIKLTDFDHACKIGSALPSLTEPFARLLGDDGGLDRGTYGKASSRTEQFAIGSAIYALTRGYNPYEDEWWGHDHGPVCQNKLQNMEFPDLGKERYDGIIRACWHGQYESVTQLSENLANLGGNSQVIEKQPNASETRLRKYECEIWVQNGVLEQLFTF